jgi:hypothetical protein
LRDAMREALADAREDAAGVLVALVVGDQAAIPVSSDIKDCRWECSLFL